MFFGKRVFQSAIGSTEFISSTIMAGPKPAETEQPTVPGRIVNCKRETDYPEPSSGERRALGMQLNRVSKGIFQASTHAERCADRFRSLPLTNELPERKTLWLKKTIAGVCSNLFSRRQNCLSLATLLERRFGTERRSRDPNRFDSGHPRGPRKCGNRTSIAKKAYEFSLRNP
jgi:hypothetical protein